MTQPSNTRPLLKVHGLRKSFGGVHALEGVSFDLNQGEVHALVGENGAGKSTLIKVLSGVHAFDDGSIELDGQPYVPANPHAAKQAGIQVVHQEFNLLNDLSVAENIAIEAMPKTRLGLLDRAEMKRRARAALDAIGLEDVDVSADVRSLGIAHRQLVEIARALQSDSRILILDEPTATLTERETIRLFKIVRDIQARGVTIVFVSHHLNEVFDICERVTVFRNGNTITTELIADTTPENVVRHMVGRELAESEAVESVASTDVVLEVSDLKTTANTTGSGIGFRLHRGEILGIAGLVGSGRTEILRGIFGADPIQGGSIALNGVETSISSPGEAISKGIGFVTEDRKEEGLILDMPIAANSSLVDLKSVTRSGLLQFSKERQMAQDGAEKLRLKYGKLADAAASLSGGNQQKVVLAKWLAKKPSILFLDEPTRGVDVGAKAEIYSILRDLARNGVSMIVVSSEMPELLTLSDRIMVMSGHAIQGTLQREDFSQERILKLAYGQQDDMERKSA